ncbi:MAG: Wzz/FepE/Etk N-terminal domain-containing protein [Syntrophales bacterium]|nr:Wzz/FepE/Etk N-terminal domain-containing protein [Syntrophales bacterium]
MNQEESRQKQYPENYPYQEDEINLIDYLRVIWKWKWLIIAGTVICAIVAGIISLQTPRIYEITTVIEPGIAGAKDDGGFVYIDSVANISGKINEGVYDPKTVFKTNVGKYSNLIKVSSEWNEKDIDLGLKASRQLIARISDEGEKVVQKRKNDFDSKISVKRDEISKIETQEKRNIDKQILVKQNEISKIETQEGKNIDKQILVKQGEISKVKAQWERDTDKQITHKMNNIKSKRNQIKFQQAMLKIIRQRIEELTLQMKEVKDNAKYSIPLSSQIYDLRTNVQVKEAKIEELNGDIDLITTEIEEIKLQRTEELKTKIDNIMAEIEKLRLQRIEGLRTKINNIRTEIEKLKLQKTEGLQAKIDDIKTQISVLTSEKENISNVKVVQNPEVSSSPVKSKKKQVVLLATVVGLFFFIFLAFFIEYIRKASKSIRAGD